MSEISEAIDSLLTRETTGVSELNTARDAAVKAIEDAYSEGMSYYKDLDISPEAWTRLSAAPIRKTIDTLYTNLVEANQRSRGTMAVRPVVDEAFSATVPIAGQSVKDAATFGSNLATKRADLLGQKGAGVASANLTSADAVARLRSGTSGLVSGLRSDKAKMDWQGEEAEKNRALERIKYASTVMPDSASSLYRDAGLGTLNVRSLLGSTPEGGIGTVGRDIAPEEATPDYGELLSSYRQAQWMKDSYADPWSPNYDYMSSGKMQGTMNSIASRLTKKPASQVRSRAF